MQISLVLKRNTALTSGALAGAGWGGGGSCGSHSTSVGPGNSFLYSDISILSIAVHVYSSKSFVYYVFSMHGSRATDKPHEIYPVMCCDSHFTQVL